MGKDLLAIFLLVLLGVGCTKESYKDCPSNLLLHYEYSLNSKDENRFDDEVDKITLYLFDKDSLYYDTFVESNTSELHNDNQISLPLTSGRWHLVSWGGQLSKYRVSDLGVATKSHSQSRVDQGLVKGVTKLNDFSLAINADREVDSENVEVSTLPEDIFYGAATSIDLNSQEDKRVNIPMIKNNKLLKFSITGLGNLIEGRSNVDLSINAQINNEKYNHKNELTSDNRIVNYGEHFKAISGDTILVNIGVLRLFQSDSTSKIVLKSSALLSRSNSGGSIEIPIVPAIKQNPKYLSQTDFDKEQEFNFNFDFSSSLVPTITIEGWKVKGVIVNVK